MAWWNTSSAVTQKRPRSPSVRSWRTSRPNWAWQRKPITGVSHHQKRSQLAPFFYAVFKDSVAACLGVALFCNRKLSQNHVDLRQAALLIEELGSRHAGRGGCGGRCRWGGGR